MSLNVAASCPISSCDFTVTSLERSPCPTSLGDLDDLDDRLGDLVGEDARRRGPPAARHRRIPSGRFWPDLAAAAVMIDAVHARANRSELAREHRHADVDDLLDDRR